MSSPTTPPRGFHLIDLGALVVGYSLASLLIRAFWPGVASSDGVSLFVLAFAFVWLGLAMSGPLVLLARGPTGNPEQPAARQTSRTWAELAWLIIGFYWLGLTILVVPVRLHNTRVLDTAFLGLFPVVAAVMLRFFRPRSNSYGDLRTRWTHRTAIALLVSWPVAWIALVLLGKNLP
jgi:hypothetical protein